MSRIIDAGGAPVSLITNAASSTIKGLDLEIVARPSSNFDVSASYGYLDAKYDSYAFNATTNFSGTSLVRAPKHSVSTGVEWRIPFGDRDQLTLRADYALLGDFFHEPGQGEIRFGTGIPLTAEDGYGLLDLRASYQHGPFRLTGYVNNVTDKEYRRTVNALGSTVVGFAGTPRLYGLKIGYTY